jgi:four helix bundle protein
VVLERNEEARMTKDEGMSERPTSSERGDKFWTDEAGPVIQEEPNASRAYDLEERTARFGEAVIDFAKTVPRGPVTDRTITQLIGAATSVGANCVEADDSVSKREFLKCIGTCKKEARETKHFLRMAVRAAPELKSAARDTWFEARELHLILAKIWRSGRKE